jgi:glycosyltransferase involved in cell wall biosynthesis
MHSVALAVARGANAGAPRPRDPSGATIPRSYLFDDAFSHSWDESILGSGGGSGVLPSWWRLAREVRRRDSHYEAVVTWGEKLSLAMLMEQQLARAGKPHIAMMYQFEKPNIRVPLRLLQRNLHAVVTWSSVQRQALIQRLGYPAERVYLIRHYVDQVFYSPRPAESDLICSVGAEMRDYATLCEALRGTNIRCHIAADHVRIPGRFRLLNDRRVPVDAVTAGAAGEYLTTGRKTLPELRDLYARSRFVVVPLLHSDTDNGITVILEAMAMGKAVICSRTRGQVDAVEEGVNGLYVPVGDAKALRNAILSLWNDPLRAQQMGRNARALVEKHHTLEKFTATVRSAAEALLDGRFAPQTWWE